MIEYSKKIDIQVSDCDVSGRLRPSVAQTRLQELGEEHAALFGLSFAELLARDMCWVLYRQHIRFRRMPVASTVLHAKTWPGKVVGPVFPRLFTLDQEGERVGEAISSWVLMKVSSRRPLRPSVLEGQLPHAQNIPDPLPLPGVLRIENARYVCDRQVRYADVDVNGHMNNTKYTDWICDLLPFERLRASGLCQWQIHYISEALPGETLALSIAEEGGDTYVQGQKKHDGRIAFEAKVSYGEEGS